MNRIFTHGRIGIMIAALAAFSAPLLTPTPAAAWWHHGWAPGWRGGYGWHAGYGWHPGWGYGWRGCCWGPHVVIGVAPPLVAPPLVAPPPVVAGRVWVGGHWSGP